MRDRSLGACRNNRVKRGAAVAHEMRSYKSKHESGEQVACRTG